MSDYQKERDLQRMHQLAEQLLRWNDEYYRLHQPSVDDLVYDRVFEELKKLEECYPDDLLPYSPTQRIGSDRDNVLQERPHRYRILSLDKAYSLEDLDRWQKRVFDTLASQDLSLALDQKIDGVAIVLNYQNGFFVEALSRGDGRVGMDVSENIKTLLHIPLVLPRSLDVSIRGEIFMNLQDFDRLNTEKLYANPRNFVAGALRRQKSSLVAQIPLRSFFYELFSLDEDLFDTHSQGLDFLEAWGFPVNPERKTIPFFDRKALEDYLLQQGKQRPHLPYQIDGLVLRLNQRSLFAALGETSHHPRGAIAFKFDSPSHVTQLENISVQIGRSGRLTPLAHLKAVEIGGSFIRRASLHNPLYIEALELSLGDWVLVSKRGDVIPAVEKIVEKSGAPVWIMPRNCPACGNLVEWKTPQVFCVNPSCPGILKARLEFFVGRSQMDIETLSSKTIEFLFSEGFVRNFADLYRLDFSRLRGWKGFASLKIEALRRGIEKSKQQTFSRLMIALGIPEIGPKAVEIIIHAGWCSWDSWCQLASDPQGPQKLLELYGIGPKLVEEWFAWMKDPENQSLVRELIALGLPEREEDQNHDNVLQGPLLGQIWCITGVFSHLGSRQVITQKLKAAGAHVVSDVTKETTHLLMGNKAGSKYLKAQKIGLKIVLEDELSVLL